MMSILLIIVLVIYVMGFFVTLYSLYDNGKYHISTTDVFKDLLKSIVMSLGWPIVVPIIFCSFMKYKK